jgi:DNA-binding MarR family transcriptional regulator
MAEVMFQATGWCFLTNHSHVLVAIHRNPEIRLKDLAAQVGITPRATQRLIRDLERAGVVSKERVGRNNRYRVDPAATPSHQLEAGHSLGELLALLDA